MINKFDDLYEILMQIWREKWALIKKKKNEKEINDDVDELKRIFSMLKNYVKASNEFEKITLNNFEFYFHLFNSRDYFKQIQYNKKLNMNFFIVNVVFFFILKMLQLRRVMNFEMNIDEQIVRIEQNISLYDVVTIELLMSQLQKSNYLIFHHELIDFLA